MDERVTGATIFVPEYVRRRIFFARSASICSIAISSASNCCALSESLLLLGLQSKLLSQLAPREFVDHPSQLSIISRGGHDDAGEN